MTDDRASWTSSEIIEQLQQRCPRLIRPAAVQLLGVNAALPLLRQLDGLDGARFVRGALDQLGVSYRGVWIGEEKIPDGAVVVVANHHLGALDGLVLLDLVLAQRKDAALLANRFSSIFPPLRPVLIEAHPLSSGKRNVTASARAISHLRQGGCLIAFPSALVASWSWRAGVADPAWQSGVGRIIQTTQANVVLAAIGARNSALFYAARALNFRLGTLMLLREMLGFRGRSIPVTLQNLPFQALEARTGRQTMEILRARLYALLKGPAGMASTPAADDAAAAASERRPHPKPG